MTDTCTIPDAGVCAPTTIHAIGAEAASTIAGALKALADPLRLRMLSAIAVDPRGESCVCDLAGLADVSQPTVSHHLTVLKETGLLTSERRGTWVWYRIAPQRRDAVTTLLDVFAPAANSIRIESEAQARAATLVAMDAQVDRLAEELNDGTTGLGRDLVVQVVRESHAALVRSATPLEHLIPRTERFARQRLVDLVRDHRTAAPQVLFVCVANAGRSQLAAALIDRLSGGEVVARSAGSTPAADVHPHVRSLLAKIVGEDKADATFSKPLTDDAVRASDVVVTMGCGDVCPLRTGVHYEDWPVGDPALASPEGAAAIRDDIEARVRGLLGRPAIA